MTNGLFTLLRLRRGAIANYVPSWRRWRHTKWKHNSHNAPEYTHT